jgi:hypothetical protein
MTGTDRKGRDQRHQGGHGAKPGPGSQTFEQDLFRLYKDKRHHLDEALANSDSPTNLSWLINNSQFGNGNAPTRSRPRRPLARSTSKPPDPGGASFTEFTLNSTTKIDKRPTLPGTTPAR